MTTADGGLSIGQRFIRIEEGLDKKAERSEVEQLGDELRSLRRTLVAFMATISGSAILFSFTMLQVLAHK